MISELVQLDSFREAIKYNDTQFKSNHNDDKSGENVFSRNMNEMKIEFQKFLSNFESSANNNVEKGDVIMINLVISWFYDSAQIYHRRQSIFAPLIMTIKNLPPNIMNELGFGTFLLSLITYSAGSEVEKFIIFDCFIAELLSFQKGVSIIVGKTLYRVQIRIGTHILDMPALCKIMNLEYCFNSKYGCPFCNWGKGHYDPLIRKCKYMNTGNCLGMRGYFNLFGNTQQCLPHDWYLKTIVSSPDDLNLIAEQIAQAPEIISANKKLNNKKIDSVVDHIGNSFNDLAFRVKWKTKPNLLTTDSLTIEKWCENKSLWKNEVIIEYLRTTETLLYFYNEHILDIVPIIKLPNKVKKCSDGFHEDQIYIEELKLSYDNKIETKENTIKREEALIRYLKAKTEKGTSPPLFLNSDILDIDDIEYNKLSDDIYSIHCDFRKCEHFKYLTNEELKRRTIRALELNKENKTKKIIAYKGCKDWWPFLILSYVDVGDTGFEGAHIIFNTCKQVIELWKGSSKHRQNLPGVKAYCKKYNLHPSVWDSKYVKEWEFTNKAQLRTQSFLKCLIIPKGSKDYMKVVKGLIFERTGHIKGMGRVAIIKTLMNLILFSNANMRPSYKGLFRTFSCILQRWFVKYPNPNDFDILFWRSVEFRTFFEKLIPVTEMTMNIHALPECIYNTKKQGSLFDCWACPGERDHSTFKALAHVIGGVRPELNVWNKYSIIENNSIIQNYNFLDKLIAEGGINTSSWKGVKQNHKMRNLSYNKDSSNFIYDDESISLRGVYSVALGDFEYSKIIETLFNEILNFYSQDTYICIEKSSAFRVMYVILNLKSKTETAFVCLKKLLDPINSILLIREQFLINPTFLLQCSLNDKINRSQEMIRTSWKSNNSILDLIDLLKLHLLPFINDQKQLDEIISSFNDTENLIFKYHEDLSLLIKSDIISSKKILDFDVETMLTLFKWKRKFYISNNIDFGGTLFTGRGILFSEKSDLISNSNNKLDNEWYKRSQYNSWVRLKQLCYKFIDNRRAGLPVYANLNYSFNFTLKTNNINCPYLSQHCHISSITSYRCMIQHRESVIVTDARGINSIINKYPNQLDQSDHFHNSRMPYLNLSKGATFNSYLPYFINSKKIYQTRVASIAFSKIYNKKTKEMNYKAIDIFSKYEDKQKISDEKVPKKQKSSDEKETKEKSNDIINIDDPNCKPSLLVFIDVKPELTIEPETNIIKQEIKDIHKIWINEENIYDSGSDDDHELVPDIFAGDNKFVADIFADDNVIDKNPRVIINNNIYDSEYENIDIMTNNINEKPLVISYYGFKWKDNSCAFDSLVVITYYAFVEMTFDQRQIFMDTFGRVSEIFTEMTERFTNRETKEAFAKYKEELISIYYKQDVDYNFKRQLGEFLSVNEIHSNVLRNCNSKQKCIDSFGVQGVFDILCHRYYFCNNLDCNQFGKAFQYKVEGNLYNNGPVVFTLKSIAPSASIGIKNYPIGINSKPDVKTISCNSCESKNILYKKVMKGFPLLLLLEHNLQRFTFEHNLELQDENDKIVFYKLIGIIYGDGTHFTASIFMNNNKSFFYDGMVDDGLLTDSPQGDFSKDLKGRQIDSLIYLKLQLDK